MRLARAGRVLLAIALLLGGASVLVWWLTPDWVSDNSLLEPEEREKARVEFSSTPEVERRVAEVDRMAARVDADRTLRERVTWAGERQVFDDGKEIRKIRNNVRSEPEKPAAYVYYYDRGYVFLIRVLWSASARPGVDEERFYFDPNALPPLIRRVGRDGRAAESWSPHDKDGHGYAIRYEATGLLDQALISFGCHRAPTPTDCLRQ